MSRATIDDVAALAGESVATVSRALRNQPYVAESTRSKVAQAAATLHYVADTNAARLASGKSQTIGLLAPILTSWYTGEVVAGVEEVLQVAGYDLLIGVASLASREQLMLGEIGFRQRVDGMILVDVFCGDRGAEALQRSDVDFVVIGERLSNTASLSIDNQYGAELATRHLIELGHSAIALVGGELEGSLHSTVPPQRLAGYRRAMASAGLSPDPMLHVAGGFTIEGGHEATRYLMSLASPPTAIFCLSDEMAFGVLQAAREMHLDVPGQLSVIGFDDHPASVAFGLSTVRQPVRRIGRLGAEMMLHSLAGSTEIGHMAVPVEVIQRNSSAARAAQSAG